MNKDTTDSITINFTSYWHYNNTQDCFGLTNIMGKTTRMSLRQGLSARIYFTSVYQSPTNMVMKLHVKVHSALYISKGKKKKHSPSFVDS